MILTQRSAPTGVANTATIPETLARLAHKVLPREVGRVRGQADIAARRHPLFLVHVVLDEVDRVRRVADGEVAPGDVAQVARRAERALEARTHQRVLHYGVLEKVVAPGPAGAGHGDAVAARRVHVPHFDVRRGRRDVDQVVAVVDGEAVDE